MANYDLVTVWRIDSPLEQVYAAILDAPRWPDWWEGLEAVTLLSAGDGDGINSRWRYRWKGKLPYRLVFDVRITHVENLVAIDGTAHGDLIGVGGWQFSRDGDTSVARCEWRVRSTIWWMNLLAPLIRGVFIRNHTMLMEQGALGLAALLKTGEIEQTDIDLTASAQPQA